MGLAKVAKVVADRVADDDSKHLLKALEDELQALALEYMLTEGEVEQILVVVRKTVDQKWLRRMYKETRDSAHSHRRFVRREFEKEFLRTIRKRPGVVPPPVEKFEEEVSDYWKTWRKLCCPQSPLRIRENRGALCKTSTPN